MKIKLDENMPMDLMGLLRRKGCDAHGVADEALGGADDHSVLQAAISEGRILMTFDLDFTDIRTYPPGRHEGIVVFRLHDQRWKTMEKPVTQLIEEGGLERLGRGLAIVEETRVRYKRPRR